MDAGHPEHPEMDARGHDPVSRALRSGSSSDYVMEITSNLIIGIGRGLSLGAVVEVAALGVVEAIMLGVVEVIAFGAGRRSGP
jgi:hypothetical protein